jgi:hypothetical protein
MKIDGVYEIKGRGTEVTTRLDDSVVANGTVIRRTSDGAEWIVRGIDRHPLPRPLMAGDPVGFLLEGDAVPSVGDETGFNDFPRMLVTQVVMRISRRRSEPHVIKMRSIDVVSYIMRNAVTGQRRSFDKSLRPIERRRQ